MKSVWTALCIVAVVNLAVLAGGIGWLKMSDRLDASRARQVRGLFTKTLTQERRERDEAEEERARALAAAEAEKKAAQVPLTAEERVALRLEATDLDRQRAERLRREVADLRRQLDDERAVLDRDKAEFAAQKTAFLRATGATLAAQDQAQFQKTLSVLSALKPKAAMSLLMEMLGPPVTPAQDAPGANNASPAAASWSEAGLARAVGYLDAMEDDARAKVMSEFARTDPRLATQLLESLRDRARFAPVPKGS